MMAPASQMLFDIIVLNIFVFLDCWSGQNKTFDDINLSIFYCFLMSYNPND